ncbi:hypothetical protein HRR83_001447 [Exophiala dermatitidis]|uniref:Uncharacterized protein n=1 Tax=Exophiala dermatitidis TaxID=5970 RepID=A0AAN6F2F2_EXODE|nr:hypothetical protein HRR74_001451 [Exophiala dermatitidis]KAJ4526802.1 hypothetical protein HRR73_001597 [Exophiala dermatitidis]KAJ4532510.1 hypothetical protein HRR76_007499 [Exophiala dermatitidis]KAJ4546980.1 hypothetical protein HRR77_004520 [Exophiala dermatitidis]KAJ4573660.1 hypothetical protein HRR79_002671 [Exophiala dermatitidis]
MSSILQRIDTLSSTIQSSLPENLQPYFTRANLQSFLRFIVIVLTYLLFRPHLESLIAKVSGRPDPKRAEVDARLEVLRRQKEQQEQGGEAGLTKSEIMMPQADGTMKKVGVVARNGKIVGLVKDEDNGGQQKGKKRKNGKGKGKGN